MLTGSCLCEAVRYQVRGRVTPIQYCHCSRCRKSTGSAFSPELAAKTEAFQWLAGQELIAEYALPVREEPPPFRRVFCRRCGARVPVADPDEPFVSIPAGSLDADPGTRPFRHIFVEVKAPWHEILDDLPKFPRRTPPEQRLPRKGDAPRS